MAEQVEEESEAETESKGDGEDPEVLGGADCAGDRRRAWIREAAVEPERQRREEEPSG